VNGIHDLGGVDGFGRVEVEPDEPVFHHAWERVVFGISTAVIVRRLANGAQFRHAIERMDPAHYLGSSYYEHWLTGVATLLVERGVVTPAELESRAGGWFPLARPVLSTDAPELARRDDAPRFALGDAVRVVNAHPLGHTRCPRYTRGRRGVIVRIDGAFPLPDVVAHADRPCDDHAYGVRFTARELWGPGAGANEAIHVDLWEHWLEPA
jgi:nitrile hydratase subunit beta